MKTWYCIEIKGLYLGKIYCNKQDLINEFKNKYLFKFEGNLVNIFGILKGY